MASNIKKKNYLIKGNSKKLIMDFYWHTQMWIISLIKITRRWECDRSTHLATQKKKPNPGFSSKLVEPVSRNRSILICVYMVFYI